MGGEKTKYQYNVAAIRTLKQIEAEGRLATPEEQETLSRYVGWGGIAGAFDENDPKWAKGFGNKVPHGLDGPLEIGIGRIQNFQADNIMLRVYAVDFYTLSVHRQFHAYGDFISGLQPLTVCRHLRNGHAGRTGDSLPLCWLGRHCRGV